MMDLDDTAGIVLAFAPLISSHGRSDAPYFRRQALEYLRRHGGGVFHVVDNSASPAARGAEVVRQILETPRKRKVISVAFFCHGWSQGIQAGFDLRKGKGLHVDELAEALAQVAAPGLILPLYACTTADEPAGAKGTDPADVPGGDGGFADRLRDALVSKGVTRCRIDAHDRKGDTTLNPYVRRFEGDGTGEERFGGEWLIAPTDPDFDRWRHELRTTSMHLDYPWLERDAIRTLLEQPQSPS